MNNADVEETADVTRNVQRMTSDPVYDLERDNAVLRERVAELEADLNAWKAGGSTGTIHQWREDAARWNFVLRHRKYSDALWNAVPIKKFMEERHLNNIIDAERGKP